MKHVILVGCCLAVLLACSCRKNPQSESMSRDGLTTAAEETHAAYVKAVHAGTQKPVVEIPRVYWAKRIRAMKPVRVYTHRVNVVIVERVTHGMEEGKYVYIPLSSYRPIGPDDGFVFSPDPLSGDTHPLGAGVYDYKRSPIPS